MKFNITGVIVAVAIMLPRASFALQGYIVAACNATKNTYQAQMCNNTGYNCGSGSTTVSPTGQYASYDTCGAFSVSGLSYKLLICFSSSQACQYLTSCNPDFTGTVSLVSLSSTTVGTLATVSNYAFYECCQTCTASEWYDLESNGRPYQRKDTRTCSAVGQCYAAPRWYVRCPANYYNSAGWSEMMNLAATNTLPTCLSCADQTGVPGARSAAGSSAITDCYVGDWASISDEAGEYSFISDCYYQN